MKAKVPTAASGEVVELAPAALAALEAASEGLFDN